MEIKKLSENKIRCALTEQEIQSMGFEIDEILGDAETTQRFMKSVVEQIEEHEDFSFDHVSPIVKAELLSDHSMAITFGGDTEQSLRGLVDTVGQLMSQLSPEKLEEFQNLNREEKESVIDRCLSGKQKEEQQTQTPQQEEADQPAQKQENPAEDQKQKLCEAVFENPTPFALECDSMEDVIELCKNVHFAEHIPASSLYRIGEKLYLVLDFIHFTKEEVRPLAFAIVEYNNRRFSSAAEIAFIEEHGTCIVENEALQTLMQL